ncbi:MAG: carbon-nitrogen hydrolase family protein [Rhodobacteraceae bacterium]|nr:carbon-nitrogen hydrolase family protein [Paracoccaceae bacterium]
MTQAALLQLNACDDPIANLEVTQAFVAEAAKQGTEFILTPEVTNCVSTSRTHQRSVLQPEEEDITLAALRDQARALGVWLLIGSLAVKINDADGRFANRSFLITPDGSIAARYDKIHMFDVAVTAEETYRESTGYRPGERAVIADTPFGVVGMTICYDIRFPHLYQALAHAGATILTVPSAFSPVTGEAHWESLLRARAIETGCYVLAPAQCGQHAATRGRARWTYGHSMVVAPWGEVLVAAEGKPGVHIFDISPDLVAEARHRVPSLANCRPFEPPTAI